MKKFLLLALTLVLALSCNRNPKILVLYYSQGGKTETVAREIQQRLNADIATIEPVEAYPADFQATVARGNKEMEEGFLPDLMPLDVKISDYDVIFLGYPIWFGTYARPIATLLANESFKGKKVVPFCTFGSGGLETSEADIRAKLTSAKVLHGYGVRSARIDAAPAEIDQFLKAGGFIPGETVKLPDFPALHPVSEEEAAIFETAVGDYPMIRAKATKAASRPVPEGTEYVFTARDLLSAATGGDLKSEMKIYVLAADGQDPVFTRVSR